MAQRNTYIDHEARISNIVARMDSAIERVLRHPSKREVVAIDGDKVLLLMRSKSEWAVWIQFDITDRRRWDNVALKTRLEHAHLIPLLYDNIELVIAGERALIDTASEVLDSFEQRFRAEEEN